MKLIIIGAGGHGQVVSEIADQLGIYNEILFLDDYSKNSKVVGRCDDYIKFINSSNRFYPAFGNNEFRLYWANKLLSSGAKLAKIIHPLAYISPSAKIDDGCIIMPYAIVNTNTIIKKTCIINFHAIVDHDCIIEEGCHIEPGAIVKALNHINTKTIVDSGEVIPIKYFR